MSNERKHHSPEEKVAILRRHLIDKIPVSTLCDEHDLHPTVFYRRLKQFFENGPAACATATRNARQESWHGSGNTGQRDCWYAWRDARHSTIPECAAQCVSRNRMPHFCYIGPGDPESPISKICALILVLRVSCRSWRRAVSAASSRRYTNPQEGSSSQ